jgi:hypothetical protein
MWRGWEERGLGAVQCVALLAIEAAPQLSLPAQPRQGPLRSSGLDPPKLARLTSQEGMSVLGGQDA